MRKIIIAICGVMLACTTASAKVKVVTDDFKNAWEYDRSTPEYITSSFQIKKNEAHSNFEYVDIAAAVKIYKNGAKFCRMQLQHNFQKWVIFPASWSCKTICKNGWYGNECDSQEITLSDCEPDNLKEIFDTSNSGFDSTPKDIDGFVDSVAYAALLQIISADEHSIIVAPVEYSGNDNGDMKTIKTIYILGKKNTLCAQGYKLENNKCVLIEKCKELLSDVEWCAGWEDSTPNYAIHELFENGTCKEYRCKGNNGFEKGAKGNCIPCATTLKQGINSSGECEQCEEPNEMFTNDGCKPYKKLSLLQLKKGFQGVFDCWQELGSDNYKKCVLCESPKSYNKTEKTCQ